MIISDEAHYIKSRDAKRSKRLMPLYQRAEHLLLLTGTPILNTPTELYNLIRILRPDVTPSFNMFTQRYCDPRPGRYGMEYTGATCKQELGFVLRERIMVRRLKEDVLSELPEKTRQRLFVKTD
jgi:SWI/SNF-related matrix-associated actin-dependent regulator of chromatin subfamily A-like protein 1